METLERKAKQIRGVLRDMPAQDTYRVQRVLHQLTRGQVSFVRGILERARDEDRCTGSHFNLLDFAFERWWAHSLETKLALVACILRLSDSESWPDDTPEGRTVSRILGQTDSVSQPPQHVT